MGLTEIIVSLVDQASDAASSMANNISSSMSSIGSSSENASVDVESIGSAAEEAGSELDTLDGSNMSEIEGEASSAAGSIEEVGSSADSASTQVDGIADAAAHAGAGMGVGMDEASTAIDQVSTSADRAAEKTEEIGTSANSASAESTLSMAAVTAGLGTLTAGSEAAAQKADTLEATFEKMSSVKMPEAEVKSMVTSLTNATFPTEDALLYIKTLKQIGITSETSLSQGASAFNKIALATGVSSDQVVTFSNSMVAMGIDMNNIPSTFNAIAYANANLVGGFSTYIGWMQKYDSTFKSMGLNIDQTAVLIAAATKKFGGGRAAYSGLNTAIKESNGDLSVLEQKLGMQPGSLENASQATAAYSGKIDQNAAITEKHTTLLQKMKAAVDDLSTTYGGSISQVASFGGAIGGLITAYTGLSTARSAAALAAGAETGAENVGILSKIRAAVTSWAYATSTYGSSAALDVAAGAAAAHAGAIATDTEAENVGILSKARAAITGGAATAALIAHAVAAKASAAAQWLLNIAMDANPVALIVIAIVALVAILAALYTKNETVRNALNGAWNQIKAIVIPAINQIVNGVKALWGAITQIAGAIGGFFSGILTKVTTFFTSLWAKAGEGGRTGINQVAFFIGELIGKFLKFWIDLGVQFIIYSTKALTGLVAWLMQLPGTVWMWLTAAINYVIEWAGQLGSWALTAGSNLLNGVISFVQNLPSNLWNFLWSSIQRIISFAASAYSQAGSAGRNILNGIVNAITGLPGQVWNILLGVYNNIVSFGSYVWNAAVGVGQSIWNGITAGLSGSSSAAGGDADLFGAGSDTELTTSTDSTISVDANLNITHDFKNVPPTLSTSELAKQVVKAMDDSKVQKKLDEVIGATKRSVTRRTGGFA